MQGLRRRLRSFLAYYYLWKAGGGGFLLIRYYSWRRLLPYRLEVRANQLLAALRLSYRVNWYDKSYLEKEIDWRPNPRR